MFSKYLLRAIQTNFFVLKLINIFFQCKIYDLYVQNIYL